MVSSIYKKTFSVLMKRPFRLWGISLLAEFLCLVAYAGFIGVPAAAFCAALLLSASMSMIFLNSYRTGLEPKTTYLFASFKKDRILRVLGGMAWMQLWIFLWSLIPIVGIVFGIIRMYEYRFVPYILMTRDDVKPTDAIKISKQETMGYKGKMFGADILLGAVYLGAFLVFTLLGKIPYLGVLFRILWVLIAIAYGLLAPLFSGIMQAAFYVEIQNRRAAGQQPSARHPGPGFRARDAARPAGRARCDRTGARSACPAGAGTGSSGTAAINGTALPALRRTRQNAGRSVLHCLRKETGMSIVLFILALAAAFIGTIFAFRAVHRIHNGESYTYESTACAACVTLIVLALMLR